MIISTNYRLVDGSWGGGSQFVTGLLKKFEKMGHKVRNDLNDRIDIILLKTNKSHQYTYKDILRYKKNKHKSVIVVHRASEAYRPKGDQVGQSINEESKVADATIFLSKYHKKYYEKRGWRKKRNKTILNSADERIFKLGKREWNGRGRIKVVTHHWSDDVDKGFKIYGDFGRLLKNTDFGEKFVFTYVGRYNKQYFKDTNIKIIRPLHGEKLGAELRNHHIYLTASKYEAGPNHVGEAMQCGLPVAYLDNGGLPEYCNDFGVMFEGRDDYVEALEILRDEYMAHKVHLNKNYDRCLEKTAKQYIEFFKECL